jgi:hypothetical protein
VISPNGASKTPTAFASRCAHLRALTAETLTKDGRWAVVIFNRNAADVTFRYEFTIGRQ